MHPAPSIIMFTALSGVGFGLLIWLGLGVPALSGWAAFWAFGLAYGLSVVGLISSTLHLGHPERALKAFSQWRSSWLSREGVVSVAALVVMAPFAFWRVFLVPGGVGGLEGLEWLEGLRWLGVLADEGLVLREPDPDDQRRILVRLTERGARAMDEYFAAAAEA